MAVAVGLPQQSIGWCDSYVAVCNSVWWCGPQEWAMKTATGAIIWLCLFYFIAFLIYPLFEQRLHRIPSKYNVESTSYWFAWHTVSAIHALVVSAKTIGPVSALSSASRDVQMGSPSEGVPYFLGAAHAACGNASHIFLCFILYDVVVILIHKLAKMDMLVHHALFISFCAVVQYHCMLGYLAGWMMLMELSTIFLNVYSFFRNRLGNGHWIVKGAFLCFAVTYMALRVVGMGYVVIIFISALWHNPEIFEQSGVGAQGVPGLHLSFIFVGVVAAWGLQLAWGLQGVGPKLFKVWAARKKED